MKKIVKLLPLLLVASLTACDSIYIDTVFCFDTVVNFKFTSSAGYSGNATENQIKKILKDYDALLDSYNKRDVFNVFDLPIDIFIPVMGNIKDIKESRNDVEKQIFKECSFPNVFH